MGCHMTGDPVNRDSDDLSISEKILRVQDLWDEIARSPRDVQLTSAQLEEAERRLAEHEKNPHASITWDALKRELERGS